MSYSPLQNISSYSLLQSTNTLPKLIKNAKEKGYQAVALTDRNVMYGAVAFYKEARKQNIKPIIGLTISVKGSVLAEHAFDLVLLAKNQNGYQNLMRISTEIMTNDDLLSIVDLKDYLKDLFVLLPKTSEITNLLGYKKEPEAVQAIDELFKIVDNNSLKLGISEDSNDDEMKMMQQFAKKVGLDLFALNPVEYLKATDYFDTRVLKSISAGAELNNVTQQKNEIGKKWLKPREEVESFYNNKKLQKSLTVNQQIVDACNVKIPKEKPQLPHFENNLGKTSAEYLRDLCMQGLNEKGIDKNQLPVYKKRLKHELDVINRMGFDDYFLIVWDVVNFAHTHNILTGPGRGSAAGSLVAYCLKITDVDPIKYDLLFERFLNEDRAQMPDIDLDIPDDKRDEILNYVHDKYGNDRVAQIVTFGTLGAKQSIRDVGRVFGMRPEQMSKWSSAIPNHLHETLKDAINESQKLKNIVADDELNRTLFNTASQLEGLPRHFSTHAAGLILSDNPIVERSPLQMGNDGLLMTQYSKYYVEDVGLLKIDFLGLRNLSIMANIIQSIHQQGDKNFDINKINLNDPKTLRLFQTGKTNGVFQFESSGIKSVLKRMHPDDFSLIAAVNALYRPGPMENIDTFIARKNGKEKVSYPNNAIKKILGTTYGIIVYQEQVMQLASSMGGFSLGQADVLRRAMSKKHKDEMEAMRNRFVSGATNNGYSKETAESTFDYIERFASYGFNKSHAIAYSKMAFQLAYLKAHYPGNFFAALLNSVLGNAAKIKTYVQEAKDSGIKVLEPDINNSKQDFFYENGEIRYGLNAVKGIRSDFINEILQVRKKGGKFKSIDNFIDRLNPRFRKVDQIKILAYTGAFDSFAYNRREVVDAIQPLIDASEYSGTLLAIPSMKYEIKHKDDFLEWQKINYESKYLGTFLSGHPVERYDDLKRNKRALRTNQFKDGQKNINTILLITHIKTIRTKKGQLMAFIDGSDQFGNVDITIFPQLYKQISGWLKQNMVVLVAGNVEKRRELQLVANTITPAANVKHEKLKHKRIYLRITKTSGDIFTKLQKIIKQYPGNTSIVLNEKNINKTRLLNDKFNVNPNVEVIKKFKELLGEKNVVYR